MIPRPHLSPLTILLSLVALALPATFATPAAADDDAGKKVFIEQECNGCHTLKAQGIELTEIEEEEGDADDDREPPDLSGIGNERDKRWIAQYLIKKVDIDGEEHPRRFRGAKEELAAIATWLEAQKAEAEDAEATEGAEAAEAAE